MSCQTCGGNDVCVVGFESADGATYQFCRTCETGRWESNGTKRAVHDILIAAASIEPAGRGRR